MNDINTYLLYTLLLFTLMFMVRPHRVSSGGLLFADKSSTLRVQHYFALLLMSFVLGFRYNVGYDWMGYKDHYEMIQSASDFQYIDQYMEFGFFYMNKFIASIDLSYEWMFFTTVLITWFFLFRSVPIALLPLFIFFIFVDEYFFWGLNGVRQFMAIGIWTFSIRFVISREPINFILFLSIAALFHTSVLLLMPFYFFPYHYVMKRKLWLILFGVSFLIGSSDTFVSLIEDGVTAVSARFDFLSSYQKYVSANRLVQDETTLLGFGFYFKILVNLLIFIIADRVVEKHADAKVYFVLFFIGAVIFNISYNIQLIRRVNHYFIFMRTIVLAISVWHFWRNPKYRPIVSTFAIAYFVLFLRAIYSSSNLCSPFQFSFSE